jgi:hypothetical protein
MARTRGLAMWRDPSLPVLPQTPRPLATRMHNTTASRSFSLALMAASHPRFSCMSSALERAMAPPPAGTRGRRRRSLVDGGPVGFDRVGGGGELKPRWIETELRSAAYLAHALPTDLFAFAILVVTHELHARLCPISSLYLYFSHDTTSYSYNSLFSPLQNLSH